MDGFRLGLSGGGRRLPVPLTTLTVGASRVGIGDGSAGAAGTVTSNARALKLRFLRRGAAAMKMDGGGLKEKQDSIIALAESQTRLRPISPYWN